MPDQTNQRSVGANETHPFPSSDGHGRLTVLPWRCSDGNLCLHNYNYEYIDSQAQRFANVLIILYF